MKKILVTVLMTFAITDVSAQMKILENKVLSRWEFESFIKKYVDDSTHFSLIIDSLKDEQKKENFSSTDKSKLVKEYENAKTKLDQSNEASGILRRRSQITLIDSSFKRSQEMLNALYCHSWNQFIGLQNGDDISKATELFGEGGYIKRGGKVKYYVDSIKKIVNTNTLIYKHRNKEVLFITYESRSRLIKEIVLEDLYGKEFIDIKKNKFKDDKYLIIGMKRQRLRDALESSCDIGYDGREKEGMFFYDDGKLKIRFWATEENNFNISRILVSWWYNKLN